MGAKERSKKVRTRIEWWSELSNLSTNIASLNVPTDESYWDDEANQPINKIAFNLSGCASHNQAIAHWADSLIQNGASLCQVEKLISDLTSRNTYGAFSELAAYGLFLDAGIPFGIQIPVEGRHILNPNGSDLDGVLRIGDDVYFDVKAFGLHENLVDELRSKLALAFPSRFLAFGGSKDVGVSEISSLFQRDTFNDLVAELTANGQASRGKLDIKVEPKRSVNFATNFFNPYELAENHADYAFRFAKQFVRRKPFILVFVIHPWLGGMRLSQNFASDTEIFMRSFARRTFMQFRTDRTRVFGVTRGTVSRYLSGMMFVDAWQQQSDKPAVHRLYLNSNAKNPISSLTRDQLAANVPDMHLDDFKYDTY